jgi:endonuclease G, mitochondrial
MTDVSAPAGALPTAQDLDDRPGYDPAFLGPAVPMPAIVSSEPTVLLHYLHYSVLFRPDRRFAAVTALDMDGARLMQVDRRDDWNLDPRLAAELQAGPPVYARNDLDRGHLVRRASSTWGDSEAEARRAEADTFFFTNAAPQNKHFNQGRELWLGLEDYLQDHAAAHDRKLVVLAGPVLDPADPPYRGIRIPLRFWKVAAFIQDGALAATGYLLDQAPLVDDLQAAIAETPAGQLPPLGAFRTFQVPVADLAAVAGVVLDQLVLADLMGAAATGEAPPPGRANTGWLQLSSLDDVILTG